MAVLHFVTDSVAPQPGGMQESVLRIARGFAARGDEVHIHTLKQAKEYRTPPRLEDGITIHDLGARSGDLLDPFREGPAPESEETRIRYVILRNQIAHFLRGGGRQTLISFYATGAGFLTQHVAASLGLPHVASFRGTDYGRDLLAAATHSKIRFVAESAARIVTTNHEQAAGLTAMFPVRHPIRVIYNSLAGLDQRPVWTHAPAPSVRFVSDSGLSSRKATHLLLRSCAHVIDRGLPVSLTVFGGVFAKDPPEY